jgi:hypothetical protein
MWEALKSLGLPAGVLGVLAGATLGWAASDHWRGKQLETEQTRLQLVIEERDELQQDHDKALAQLNQQLRATGDGWNTERAALQQRLDQCVSVTHDWNKNYEQLLQNKRAWEQRADLSERLRTLQREWEEASGSVKSFVNGRYADGLSNCDLTSLGLRQLKAREAERDQLHAQMLDLQSRLTCALKP